MVSENNGAVQRAWLRNDEIRQCDDSEAACRRSMMGAAGCPSPDISPGLALKGDVGAWVWGGMAGGRSKRPPVSLCSRVGRCDVGSTRMPSPSGRAVPLGVPRSRETAGGSGRRGTQAGVGQREGGLRGAGRGHGDLEAADGDGDAGSDVQQLQADGAAGGRGKAAVGEADPPQRRQQQVGERGEPQPELVGAPPRGAGAVGKEIELAFLDPVLPLAAGAVELFVERAGRPATGRGFCVKATTSSYRRCWLVRFV
jgi:hypothetical protein